MEQTNNLKVVITRGLPASGKTTYAYEWIKEDPDNRVIVEKDRLRLDSRLFPDGVYNHKRGDEAIVIKERDRLVDQALSSGKSVICSDTNLVQKHVTRLSNLARKYGAKAEVVNFLDVPLEELIKRDQARVGSVGEQVIRKMFHEQVKTMPTFLKYDPNLPFVVVSDLDGTLTLGPKDRSPYEWHKVGNDELNMGVAKMLDGMSVFNFEMPVEYQMPVFIFSGRDEVCRPETEEWLLNNHVEYQLLVMRPHGDNRSDVEIKKEYIEEHIKGKYNVLIWFDDRVRVANMLRDVYGINVAQMGDPRYEF